MVQGPNPRRHPLTWLLCPIFQAQPELSGYDSSDMMKTTRWQCLEHRSASLVIWSDWPYRMPLVDLERYRTRKVCDPYLFVFGLLSQEWHAVWNAYRGIYSVIYKILLARPDIPLNDYTWVFRKFGWKRKGMILACNWMEWSRHHFWK